MHHPILFRFFLLLFSLFLKTAECTIQYICPITFAPELILTNPVFSWKKQRQSINLGQKWKTIIIDQHPEILPKKKITLYHEIPPPPFGDSSCGIGGLIITKKNICALFSQPSSRLFATDLIVAKYNGTGATFLPWLCYAMHTKALSRAQQLSDQTGCESEIEIPDIISRCSQMTWEFRWRFLAAPFSSILIKMQLNTNSFSGKQNVTFKKWK